MTENGWRTDDGGRFVIEGVPQGTASVYAWVMGPNGFLSTHRAHARVEVKPGETVEVELALQPSR